MITLLTGQPGHGKTLRAMQLALQAKREGREVYVCNIKGIDFDKTGFKELADLADWQALPDGSFVVADEVWKYLPALGHGRRNPEWVEQLAIHRHRGFDFVFVTQQGSQISTFVRGLVDQHTHVRRKFGLNKALLLTWDRYQAATASNSEIKEARRSAFFYPKEIFDLYKSAEVHTVKRSIPWYFAALPVLALVVAALVWFVFDRLNHKSAPNGRPAGAPAALAAGGPPAVSSARVISTDEYTQRYLPRISAMPWSAPWHDDEKPRAEPDIYCVASEAKGCTCYTEQVTRLKVPILQCYEIARYGVYNPFREPLARDVGVADRSVRQDQAGRPDDLTDSRSALPVAAAVPEVTAAARPSSDRPLFKHYPVR